MIYLFHGTDVSRVRSKAFAWVAAARAKAPDAAYIRLEGREITKDALRGAIATQGLFFSKALILIDDPFADASTADVVLDMLDELAASENPIALVAPKLLAARAAKIEKQAAKVFKEDARPVAARGFNSALVNALGARKGEVLWLEIVKALRAGDAPEAIHGLLHWKVRDLMQKGSAAWTPEEVRALSVALITLVSDARSGDLPLAPALERFALSLSGH